MLQDDNEQEQLAKLLGLIEEALQQDQELRQKYQVGEKFRFIRDRLQALLAEVQGGSSSVETRSTSQVKTVTVEADEMVVFVHLYNAQGGSTRSWENIITPKAFFDFSVNRPIYKEKEHIETFVRAKANKTQHGYLVIAVKADRLLKTGDDSLKDAMGHPLLKVKEGALRAEKLLSFSHNGQEYVLTEQGDLIKKA